MISESRRRFQMPKGPLFIERGTFEQIIDGILNSSGQKYQDVNAIYGDMSRLVVSWLANSTLSDLQALYKDLGWGGEPNVRAMKECAKEWLNRYHPEKPTTP
jgi:hypothetical protein